MYSLDINFLKDRASSQGSGNNTRKKPGMSLPTGDLTPVYIGAAVGLCLPLFMGAAWFILQNKNAELGQSIALLEQENQKLESQIGSINKIREETNKVKGETQALVTVFDQIRPWSAMLQDMRDRIPATVQIENIKQTPPKAAAEGQPPTNAAGGIELTGFARSFNDVNDFLLTLQQSSFLKSTDSRIVTAELVDAPIPPGAVPPGTGVIIKPPQVVKYTIQSSLSEIPASELIRELEKKGTIGLVSRLRSLQQTGVIQK